VSTAYKRVLCAIIKDDANIYVMFMFIVLDHSVSQSFLFLLFFTFQQVKLNIERWFPINSDKLYKIEEDGDTIVFYFHTIPPRSILKNNFFVIFTIIVIYSYGGYLLCVF